MNENKDRHRKGILGLRVLAVLSLTAITIILTVLLMLEWIESGPFFVIFFAWYLVTIAFMWVTGGVRITDREDAERKGKEIEEDPYAEYGRDGREL